MQNWKIKILLFFLILFLLSFSSAKAQVKPADASLLSSALNKEYNKGRNVKKINRSKFNPLTLPFTGAMWFYQKVVSGQLGAGCLYHPSCSNFSKECIERHGWLKGIALSADRLSRCSRLSATEILPTVEMQNGRVLDLPENY